MFPDYGNTEYVPLDQIYILASQFCYLPWQGVCGNEVNLSSKVDLLDIETVVSIHEIEAQVVIIIIFISSLNLCYWETLH